jgi:hypothetical protein
MAEKGADGADGADGVSGAYDSCEKLLMEMEMEFKTSSLCYYKEFTYNSSKLLTNIGIWTDSGKTTKLFNKDLTYNVSKQLIETELTRISDSATLTSTFTYNSSKQLINIDRAATNCSCSSSSSSTSSSSSSTQP